MKKKKRLKRSVTIEPDFHELLQIEANFSNRTVSYMLSHYAQKGYNLLNALNFNNLLDEIADWQEKKFGDSRDQKGTLLHIKKEIDELIEDFENDASIERQGLEVADIIILLVQFCKLQGISIIYSVAAKFVENKARKWHKPDKNGVITHVKN